jgi:hypothetical protein
MQEGAFVLIDCLGFKGIWNRTDPALLLQKFSQLGPSIQTKLDVLERIFQFGEDAPLRIHHRLLSDTVAISLQLKGQEDREYTDNDRCMLVFSACLITPVVMQLFLEGEPHLVFRGCITYGQHFIENNFIVGPAIDEAAEYMNLAEGAFVWLHPSAATWHRKGKELFANTTNIDDQSLREKIKKNEEALGSNILIQHLIKLRGREALDEFFKHLIPLMTSLPFVIDPYRMPIKNGGYLECPIINPLSSVASAEERRLMMEKYEVTINGNKLDIWLKHQNTIEFLQEAEKRFQEFEANHSSQGVELSQYFLPRSPSESDSS